MARTALLFFVLGCDGSVSGARDGGGGDPRRDSDVARDDGGPITVRDAGPLPLDGGGASGPLRAFPGAEGFGTETPGGRGGRVIAVTSLASSGPGTLRAALLETGPRIVVFRVSGVIELDDHIVLGEENSFVTVAGQTSPGGITITGSGDVESYQNDFHDAVFRFLRFRGRGRADNVSFNQVHHLVFDHCDFSGGYDEAFDVTYASDVTMQWSTITNSDSSGQNYGALIAYEPTTRISLHHNFHAHHAGRCLADMHWGDLGPGPEGAIVDVRNSVVYNCRFDVPLYAENYAPGTIRWNFVGNYFRAGPDTSRENAAMFRLPAMFETEAYESDNSYEGMPVFANVRFPIAETPFPHAAVTTSPAETAWSEVLAKAGAFPRDAMNERTIREAMEGSGRLGQLGDPFIESGPEPPADSDGDGMADEWESARGFDPARADGDADADGDGYTNVEEYLADLAASLVP
jgi:hypothetical protein